MPAPEKAAVLVAIDQKPGVNTIDLATQFACDHQEVIGVIKSLAGIDGLVDLREVVSTSVQLTDEGADVANNGSLEVKVFNLISADPAGVLVKEFEALPEVTALGPAGSRARGQCMKAKWIAIDKKAEGGPRLKRLVPEVEDLVHVKLSFVLQNPELMTVEALQAAPSSQPFTSTDKVEMKKRKMVKDVTVRSYNVEKGPNFTTKPVEKESDLTPSMLDGQKYKKTVFKAFNLDAEPKQFAGSLHPLLKVRSEFRNIFIAMGFQEMPTNNYVESSFWNFDALFQPQQHPARDSHDTFFMRQPQYSSQFPEEYLERVKTMHEKGGHGSIGYRYDWSKVEASKNILRTHTTAVSTRMLYLLAQQETFTPVKYFSIDRVFRNETLDATHLAEFHQVEGLVAGYNLNLGHLIGMLTSFFEKLGMKDLKYKPAYNPYTEPSMEIFAYHPDLKKEVEIGNSGIFRPEMLKPMGLPDDVTVIAWGLSVERPTMIKYGYNNIRDLFGSSVKIELIRENPICRM